MSTTPDPTTGPAPDETRDQAVVRLLTLLSNADGAINSDETWFVSDLEIIAELESGGLVSVGEIIRTCGDIAVITSMRITPEGRKSLAESKAKAKASTSIGFIQQHRFAFYKWFFGIIGTLIAGYILWYLTHQ